MKRASCSGHPDGIATYDVTADGQKFILLEDKERPSLKVREMILVQNWFEELKQQFSHR